MRFWLLLACWLALGGASTHAEISASGADLPSGTLDYGAVVLSILAGSDTYLDENGATTRAGEATLQIQGSLGERKIMLASFDVPFNPNPQGADSARIVAFDVKGFASSTTCRVVYLTTPGVNPTTATWQTRDGVTPWVSGGAFNYGDDFDGESNWGLPSWGYAENNGTLYEFQTPTSDQDSLVIARGWPFFRFLAEHRGQRVNLVWFTGVDTLGGWTYPPGALTASSKEGLDSGPILRIYGSGSWAGVNR